jgi:hypothetical protein
VCAAVAILDLLILNEDRHADNFLMIPDGGDGLRVLAIDHEQAWVGVPGSLRPDSFPDLEKYPEDFAEHSGLRRFLRRRAAAVAAEPRSVWASVATLAGALVPETDVPVLTESLARRAAALPVLAETFLRRHRVRA